LFVFVTTSGIGDIMLPYEAPTDSAIHKEVFESTSDLVVITDHQGIITQTNNKASQIFSDGPYLGVTFWVRLGLECSNLNEALALFSAIEYAPGSIGISYTCETTHTVYHINLVPMGDYNNLPEGFLLILNDITCLVTHRAELERQVKERALALARSKKMLQTVFQGIGKGIILVDEDREVIESNQKACEIFGLHPENILGAPICSLCDDSNKETVLATMDTIIENQILSLELTALYFDKSIFPAVFTVSLITVEEHKLWIIIVEDISEQKSMEQQLKSEKIHTEEVNITLRNVLNNIQNEQQELADKLSHRIVHEILPALNKIKTAPSDDVRNGYIDFLGELMVSLTKGTDAELDSGLLRLSKTEMKICKFIQSGFSSKEICTTMNLAFDTIQTHRKNIRKKLGLAGKGTTSLHGYFINHKMS
jgi:PAS domain S-box-containing protein